MRPPTGAGCIGSGRVLPAIHDDHFHFGAIVEDVAAGDHEVGDFPLLDAAEAIGDAVDFGGRERQGAQGGVAGEAVVEGLLDGALQVAGLIEAVGVEGELDAGLLENGGRRGGLVAGLESAHAVGLVGIGVARRRRASAC